MPESLDRVRREISLANRMLAREGVLDAFGHVSARHPGDPNRYFLSRSRAPELVEPDDILEFTLDSEPVKPTNLRLYAERVIHGEIYKARPDVLAVCHHHAPAIMPYVISGVDIVPVFHLGATMGAKAPFWDQRDEFGDTNLLVVKPEEGRSLARTLGSNWLVLMRHHGATAAGRNLHELVFRTIYSVRNAEFLTEAKTLGAVSALTAGEIERASNFNLGSGLVVDRAWEYWAMRLEKAEKGFAPSRKTMPKKSTASGNRLSKRRVTGKRSKKGRKAK